MTLSLSTRRASVSAAGCLPPVSEVSYPVSSSHRRGHGRAHHRPVSVGRVDASAAHEGAAAGSFVAPSCRHAPILSPPFVAGSHQAGSACVTRRAYLDSHPAAGAPGDTGGVASAAADTVGRLVPVAADQPRVRVERSGAESVVGCVRFAAGVAGVEDGFGWSGLGDEPGDADPVDARLCPSLRRLVRGVGVPETERLVLN